MNSSNSFNICPRCGNSNSLNAKYCSRCGAQLKVPEEAVICHRCHTRNSPMANFCRNCGTTLKVGSATKICPRCGKEVNAEDSVCACGYSFVTMQQTAPKARADVSSTSTRNSSKGKTQSQSKGKGSKKDKVYSTKSGRGIAIAAMIILLIFAYLIVAPATIAREEQDPITLRPGFLSSFDKGFVFEASDDAATGQLYGWDYVAKFIGAIMGAINPDVVADYDGNGWAAFMGTLGSMSEFIISLLTVVFVLTAAVHLIVCIVRIISKKRSKKPNWYFLAMALLSTIVVALLALCNYGIIPAEGIMASIVNIFTLREGLSLGFVLYEIPLYFWFFFIYSAFAKAKVLKERAA